METELKPCGMCGGEIVTRNRFRNGPGYKVQVWVWSCTKCPSHSKYQFETQSEAIEDANRRVDTCDPCREAINALIETGECPVCHQEVPAKPSRTEAEAVRLLMEIGSREDYRLSPTHWDKTWKLLIRLGVYLGKLPDWDAYRARYGEEET